MNGTEIFLTVTIVIIVVAGVAAVFKFSLTISELRIRVEDLEKTAVRRGAGGKFKRRITDAPVVPPVTE